MAIPETGGQGTPINQPRAPLVAYVRPEIAEAKVKYTIIGDCLKGSIAVKKKGKKYLPHPTKGLKDDQAKQRYEEYILRAVFYNATRRTHEGLVGQIFARDPQIKLPTNIAYIEKDASGSGLSLPQVAKQCTDHTMAYGRVGVLVDYPQVDGVATQAQLDQGLIRPTINIYNAWDVVNWREVVIGGVKKLSLVVIMENYVVDDDGFETKTGLQYRVLRLVIPTLDDPDNVGGYSYIKDQRLPKDTPLVYQQEIWRRNEDGTNSRYYNIYEIYTVAGANGVPLDYIPFVFIGSSNNDTSVDNPPLFDLADLNIAHYRNSADKEEMLFVTGQGTLVTTGMTKQWMNDVFPNGIQLGARASLPLPAGATAQFLQLEANEHLSKEMQDKERQMVALGAKLVQQSTVQRTATEANQEHGVETSALSTISANVSAGLTQALEWSQAFVSDDTAEASIMLNKKFDLQRLSGQDLTAVVAAWQAGAIVEEEMRDVLSRSGYATLPLDEYQQAADAEAQKEADLMAKFGLPAPGQAQPAAPNKNNNKPPQNTNAG